MRPGARRDRLPRAVGARARVLRAPRAAAGPDRAPRPRRRRLELPVPVPGRGGARPRRGARRRPRLGADEGRTTSRRCARDARARARWLAAAAADCGAALDGGGRLLALGNGGSATDAIDVVADFVARRRMRVAAGRRSTSPPTPRSSPRSPTTSAPRRSSRARSSPTARRATPCSRSRRAATRSACSTRSPRPAAAGCHDRVRRLRRRPGRRRGPRRPRDRHPLAAHPAHPGGPGDRLPPAARAGRAGGPR